MRHYAAAGGLVVGGLLIALSPVLGWISVALCGDVNLFDLARLPSPSGIPFVVLPVGLVAGGVAGVVLGLALRYGTATQVTARVLGLLAAVVGGLALVGLLHAAAVSDGLVGPGGGVWVELAGVAVMLVGGFVAAPVDDSVVSGSPLWRRVAPIAAMVVVVPLLALSCVVVLSAGGFDSGGASVSSPAAALPTAPLPTASPTDTTTPFVAPPAPSTSAGSLSAAEALVEDAGYTPAPGTGWVRVAGLNVVLGTLTGSADGYTQLAFFFYDGRYLGTDTSDASAGIRESWANDQTVALTYTLYRRDDPMCCSTAGAATVRYVWSGGRVVALDPIPSSDENVALSRR